MLIKPLATADLLRKYYCRHPMAWRILLQHSRQVTKRSLKIGRFLASSRSVDLQFIAEAAMLHDIGILWTDTPELGCKGRQPYLAHGIIGSDLLRIERLERHARVCERHIGIGLTAAEIIADNLPLPARDMLPETLEEQIICYADLFYSKNRKQRHKEKTRAKVEQKLKKYGRDKVDIFLTWANLFEPELC